MLKKRKVVTDAANEDVATQNLSKGCPPHPHTARLSPGITRRDFGRLPECSACKTSARNSCTLVSTTLVSAQALPILHFQAPSHTNMGQEQGQMSASRPANQ
jgi:hypothetical protein